jgi:hypothetical protein
VIKDKIYIYGGQGKGEEFLDDIYSMRIEERIQANGELKFTAIWARIECKGNV